MKNLIKLPISKHININFRNYALYVLNNRGIPSFYDGLTNVQKFILQNAPLKFTKTITVIGNCIAAGYHHGDASLAGAINKLARPFGCANRILEGDGFFGTPVNQDAAAPRYTSVKLNPEIAKIISENSFLNKKDEDGQWEPLWVRVPVGLCTSIIGIAVGYKTTILPRSIEDMEKFFAGEIKEVKPSFIGFKGSVKRVKGKKLTWLLEGKVEVNENEKTIRVVSLPPVMSYAKFLKKMYAILEPYEKTVSVRNNSADDVDITVKFKGDEKEFENLKNKFINATKILVTETPVFVKDGVVIEYDSIEQYLTDFKYRRAELEMKRAEYFLNVTDKELLFYRAKLEYLKFMLEKKRTDKEVEEFLSAYDKETAARIDNIKLRKLTQEELKRTDNKIKELEKELKQKQNDFSEKKKIFENMKDTASQRGIQNSEVQENLFDDEGIEYEDLEGVEMFEPEEEVPEMESEEEVK